MYPKKISLVESRTDKKQVDLMIMREAVETVSMLAPEQIKIYKVQSKLMKARYDSLISEGFTESQAMEIVKTRLLYE